MYQLGINRVYFLESVWVLHYELQSNPERNVKVAAGIESVVLYLPNMKEVSIYTPAP